MSIIKFNYVRQWSYSGWGTPPPPLFELACCRTISRLAKTWLVTFSPPKTESLVISNKANLTAHPPIHMDGSVLNEVTHHKHVGIILSKDLSWHIHICEMEKKARYILNRLSQCKYTLDRRSLERVYISNIRLSWNMVT